MARINIHLTPEFEQTLAEYMRLRRIRTKSDAVRMAVLEAVEREQRRRATPDFFGWLGMATKAPENPHPRFGSDADLWD